MARPRKRVRLEDGLKLDINGLIRDGAAKTGELRRGTISLRGNRSGNEAASAFIEADLRSELQGWLTVNLGQIEQRIQLCAVKRNFGGVQWYFVCPARACRASVLWLPSGSNLFLSRGAWGRHVAYATQFETPFDRALSAARRIRNELGGPEYRSILDGVPPKPKWMRCATYDKIVRRHERHEAIAFRHVGAFLDRNKVKFRQQISIKQESPKAPSDRGRRPAE
jgi:hypothetical protein